MKKIINILAIAMIVGATITNNVDVVKAQISGMQNGDVDNSNTSNNTCYSFSYDMRKGSRDSNTNSEVTKLQEALIQLGYLSQDPSGYFGTATYNAVKSFQSAKGLLSSGFVGTYTRAVLQSATCNTPNPNPNPNPYPYPNPTPINNINLTPSTLPSTVYDKDSNGGTLSYIVLTDSNNYLYNLLSLNSSYNYVSVVNTNIPNVTVTLDKCNTNNPVNGLVYIKYYMGVCSSNTYTSVSVNMTNSVASMTDNTNYYFTLRINQNGTYIDKQYSFNYKKLNSNTCPYSIYGYQSPNCNTNSYNNNTCTSGYMNGIYGCYYNVTCNSSYDYSRGYYINTCTYINGYDNFIDKRNYNIPYDSYYNGTNILY